MIRKKYSIWFFVAAVILVPVIAFGLVKWYENNFQQLPVYGGNDHTIADFMMTDQHGDIATKKSWENKIVVADFFFTHCPTICPRMTKNLKKVQDRFNNDPQILIVSFTVDPERDSAARLQSFATKFNISDTNWQLLTGDKRDIYRLARKSFLVTATDGDGGPNDFIHSDKLVLIDQKLQIRGFYDGTNEAEVNQLTRDIRKLKNESVD